MNEPEQTASMQHQPELNLNPRSSPAKRARPLLWIIGSFIIAVALLLICYPSFPLAQSLLAVIIGYVGIHMSAHPISPDDLPSKATNYKLMFGVLSVGVILLTWFQDNSARTSAAREKSEADERFERLNGKFQEVQQTQIAALAEARTLTETISTNTAIKPEVRERVIANARQFEQIDTQLDSAAWEESLNTRIRRRRALQAIENEKRARELEAKDVVEQTEYDGNHFYYDFTVRRLMAFLEKEAASRNDQADSNFREVPRELGRHIGRTNIAVIRFRANTNYVFNVELESREGQFGRRAMVVECKGGDVTLWPSVGPNNRPNMITTRARLRISGEEFNDSIPLENYKDAIEGALGLLIAEQRKAFRPHE